MSLEGQVAIITGASSGIGAETARVLREAGMKLVITARRQDRLDALAKEIGETVSLAGDALDPAMPQRLIDTAVSAFGKCDVVFNNAGILHIKPLDKLDIEKTCLMVRVNTEAAYRLMYTAVRHFQKVGRGHLVSTSSILGTKVRPNGGWYAGTKYAIEAVHEALRMELAGTGIRISAVQPGLVITELHADWETPPAQVLGIEAPLMPIDIARCVKFVLEQPPHVNIAKLMALPGEQSI